MIFKTETDFEKYQNRLNTYLQMNPIGVKDKKLAIMAFNQNHSIQYMIPFVNLVESIFKETAFAYAPE